MSSTGNAQSFALRVPVSKTLYVSDKFMILGGTKYLPNTVKYVIRCLVFGLLTSISAVVGAIYWVQYELTKTQPMIKKTVADSNIRGMELDFCYENKCFYNLVRGSCEKRIIFTYDERLSLRLESYYKNISENELCNEKRI